MVEEMTRYASVRLYFRGGVPLLSRCPRVAMCRGLLPVSLLYGTCIGYGRAEGHGQSNPFLTLPGTYGRAGISRWSGKDTLPRTKRGTSG